MFKSPVFLLLSGAAFGAALCGLLLYSLALAPLRAERDHSRGNYQREFEAHQQTLKRLESEKWATAFLTDTLAKMREAEREQRNAAYDDAMRKIREASDRLDKAGH